MTTAGGQVRSAGIRRRVFQHCSLLATRNRCRPSPCDRLSRTRTTTAAPPRPGPLGRRWAQPPGHAGCTARRARTGTVPVFTAIRSTKEEPGFVPAASPRLPRSTSPWPPAEPPMNQPGVPRPSPWSRAGARRSRPISARFGAGTVLRDVKRRFLAYSSPPRLPDPHRLAVPARPGVVRTAPALPAPPGSGCPQPRRPAATGTTAAVSHLRSNRQRLTAHRMEAVGFLPRGRGLVFL